VREDAPEQNEVMIEGRAPPSRVERATENPPKPRANTFDLTEYEATSGMVKGL
jgi:hypothetical protein